MELMRGTILAADDDSYIRDDLKDLLKDKVERLVFSATARETWQKVVEEAPDLVLLDLKFPDANDLNLLKRIKEQFPATEVIILTSQLENVPLIVNAMKLGAYDYVPKPFVPEELLNRVRNAMNLHTLVRTQNSMIHEMEQRQGIGQLIGKSEAMQGVVATVRKFAAMDGSVLVLGESGTGKELVARALHMAGRRRNKPFVAANCASVPESLAESFFFGHRKGAFTGAIDNARGKFEAAEDGTLFLDEIGDMPLQQQAALLRVLEYRRFTPVGENREKECKARFVFATNRDLKAETRDGTFREDLYYRINVAVIQLPPLRNRMDDVPELAEHYMQRLSGEMGLGRVTLHPQVLEILKNYDWPGNVRELKHVLEGALMLLGPSRSELEFRDLPPELLAGCGRATSTLSDRELREKQDLLQALRQCDGNQTRVAKMLNWHRNTIRAKIRYYDITGF